MVATVPSGDGATCPYSLSAASACQRMQAAVSGMSRPTVSVMGLPASMVSIRPSSRAFASIRSAQAIRIRLRAPGSRRDQRPSSAARRAAATAMSTSAGPPWATSAIGRPVAGFSVTNRSPLAASRNAPSMNILVRRSRRSRSARDSSIGGMSVSVMAASRRRPGLVAASGRHRNARRRRRSRQHQPTGRIADPQGSTGLVRRRPGPPGRPRGRRRPSPTSCRAGARRRRRRRPCRSSATPGSAFWTLWL